MEGPAPAKKSVSGCNEIHPQPFDPSIYLFQTSDSKNP